MEILIEYLKKKKRQKSKLKKLRERLQVIEKTWGYVEEITKIHSDLNN